MSPRVMRTTAPTIEIEEPAICRPIGRSPQIRQEPNRVTIGASDSTRSAFVAVVLCRAWNVSVWKPASPVAPSARIRRHSRRRTAKSVPRHTNGASSAKAISQRRKFKVNGSICSRRPRAATKLLDQNKAAKARAMAGEVRACETRDVRAVAARAGTNVAMLPSACLSAEDRARGVGSHEACVPELWEYSGGSAAGVGPQS
jgi:hypothetical protein